MIRSTFNAALVTSLSILIFSFNPGEGVAGKCTKTHALHNTTTAVAGRYISLLQSPNWCTQLNSVWTFHCKTDKTCLPLNIAKILHTDNLFGKASVHLLSRFFLPRSRTHTKHYLTLTLMERKHDVLSKWATTWESNYVPCQHTRPFLHHYTLLVNAQSQSTTDKWHQTVAFLPARDPRVVHLLHCFLATRPWRQGAFCCPTRLADNTEWVHYDCMTRKVCITQKPGTEHLCREGQRTEWML